MPMGWWVGGYKCFSFSAFDCSLHCSCFMHCFFYDHLQKFFDINLNLKSECDNIFFSFDLYF
jgi:hypothetical protein